MRPIVFNGNGSMGMCVALAGKLEIFYSQVCLLEQAFVKDQDKTVTQVLAETGKAVGDEFTVRRFVRWQLGA